MYMDIEDEQFALAFLKKAAFKTLYDLMMHAERDSDRRASSIAILRYAAVVERADVKRKQEPSRTSRSAPPDVQPLRKRAPQSPATTSTPPAAATTLTVCGNQTPNPPSPACAAADPSSPRTCPSASSCSQCCHAAQAAPAPPGPEPAILNAPALCEPIPIAQPPDDTSPPHPPSECGTLTIKELIVDAPECTCGCFCYTMHHDPYLPRDPNDECECETECMGAKLCTIHCRQKIISVALLGATAALHGEPIKLRLDPEGYEDEHYVFKDSDLDVPRPESPPPDSAAAILTANDTITPPDSHPGGEVAHPPLAVPMSLETAPLATQ
jgi:hypothetical protein